jgi:hypothetical protein
MRPAVPRSLACTLALVTLGAAVVTGPAFGSRPATTAEAEFIIQAVTGSPFLKKVPPSGYQVRRIRISTVNPRYAAGALVATPGARDKVQSVVLLLRRASARSGIWRLIDLDAISCNLAPRRVLNELFGGCIPR